MAYPILYLIVILLSLAYYLLKRKYDYWRVRKVPYMEPEMLFGNYKDFVLLRRYAGFVARDICREFPGEPYIGTFYGTEPALIVQDPELIKLILARDVYYFSGREITKYCHHEPITRNMFLNGGDEWKVLRQNLTPLFSSHKMKNMFPLIQSCRDTLEDVLRSEVGQAREVEAKTLATRYVMDCIGSCVFGINTNVLTNNNTDSNIFATIGAEIFNASRSRGTKVVFRAMWPFLFYGLRFQMFAPEIEKFFTKTITEVFRSRQFKPTSRNDFVDLLMSWMDRRVIKGSAMSPSGEDRGMVSLEVTNDLLAAQCMLFFAAGFETSSTTIALTLFELAKNKEAQERVIEEVDDYMERNDGRVEFGCIEELPYLKACVNEAMRIYPILGILTRETMDDYELPSGLRVEKGVRIHIPVYHLHHDPKYFPEPEKFIPERFLGEAKNTVKPYKYMPFGEGARICIGKRFSRMQMVPAFLTIFREYSITLAEGMTRTLDFEPGGLVTQPRDNIRLMFNKRVK
ncbi:cytochrome P450 6B5-like isoform X2 [Aricia agestis]|uniref:cytochrome P450 6B5-like isoform X2 n=1 Tax=Aricia agestis TaxID=91739 RepID=UPI001C20A0DE|nr:cytochrome P450 6B5-like isoform X2 [Aricia agestis]